MFFLCLVLLSPALPPPHLHRPYLVADIPAGYFPQDLTHFFATPSTEAQPDGLFFIGILLTTTVYLPLRCSQTSTISFLCRRMRISPYAYDTTMLWDIPGIYKSILWCTLLSVPRSYYRSPWWFSWYPPNVTSNPGELGRLPAQMPRSGKRLFREHSSNKGKGRLTLNLSGDKQ